MLDNKDTDIFNYRVTGATSLVGAIITGFLLDPWLVLDGLGQNFATLVFEGNMLGHSCV